MRLHSLIVRGLLIGCLVVAVRVNAGSALKTSLTRVMDKESGLEFQMHLFKDVDGGLFGVEIRIFNTSKQDDYDFIVRRKVEDSFMIRISDSKWKQFAKLPLSSDAHDPWRPKATDGFAVVRIPKSGSHEWFFPIVDCLENPEIPQDEITANRIFVGIGLRTVSPPRSIALYAANIHLTRKALQGDARERYEKMKAQQKPSPGP